MIASEIKRQLERIKGFMISDLRKRYPRFYMHTEVLVPDKHYLIQVFTDRKCKTILEMNELIVKENKISILH